MRRRTALAVLLLLLTVLAGAVVAEIPDETGLPPDAQPQLESYIADWYPSGGARVASVARAGRPWRLTRDQSLALFSTSVQFSHSTGQLPTDTYNPERLPFPPEQVWCVLLEPEAGITERETPVPPWDLVVVALHKSLYEADWTVHIPREALPAVATVKALKAMGCDLELDYVGPLKTGS